MTKERMAALMRLAQKMKPKENMVSCFPYSASLPEGVIRDFRKWEIMREYQDRLRS